MLPLLLLLVSPLFAQTEAGELRLTIADPTGLPVPATVDLASEANQFRRTYNASTEGKVSAKRLPFGIYRLQVSRPGFAPLSELVNVRSAVPVERRVTLGLASVETAMVVSDAQTLL